MKLEKVDFNKLVLRYGNVWTYCRKPVNEKKVYQFISHLMAINKLTEEANEMCKKYENNGI